MHSSLSLVSDEEEEGREEENLVERAQPPISEVRATLQDQWIRRASLLVLAPEGPRLLVAQDA